MADNPRRAASPSDLEPSENEPARHVRTGPFGVLDVGTTKIACLIGKVEADGGLRVLGFGWHRGRGLNSGGIVDLEAAEKAIRACVGQAEDMADLLNTTRSYQANIAAMTAVKDMITHSIDLLR